MRVHYLQHVPFEGPASIAAWVAAKGNSLTSTHFYRGDALPEIDALDWLVVMGGPMNIYEHDRYPWLVDEKAFLRRVIEAGKTVIGICLGAQLIADVLGAEVIRGEHKEIGWFPIWRTLQASDSVVFAEVPDGLTVFHWHGDTFSIPEGAAHLAASRACRHQAFLFDERVLGLQFHLEATPESVAGLLAHCADELLPAPYVQEAEQILAGGADRYGEMHRVLFRMLDRLPMPGEA